jgi:hypothetical protein
MQEIAPPRRPNTIVFAPGERKTPLVLRKIFNSHLEQNLYI